jgi:hypothetical protein
MLAGAETDFKPDLPNTVRKLVQRIAARAISQLA